MLWHKAASINNNFNNNSNSNGKLTAFERVKYAKVKCVVRLLLPLGILLFSATHEIAVVCSRLLVAGCPLSGCLMPDCGGQQSCYKFPTGPLVVARSGRQTKSEFSLSLSVSMWAQLQLQFVYMCSVCHSDSAPTLSFWMLFGDSFSSYVLESEFFVVRFSNWKNVAWSATVLGVACLLDQWRRLIKNCLL